MLQAKDLINVITNISLAFGRGRSKLIPFGFPAQNIISWDALFLLFVAWLGDETSCTICWTAWVLFAIGLRVSEMTQIRAEDVGFSKGYLHVPALNAKFKKPRTVVLLPWVWIATALSWLHQMAKFRAFIPLNAHLHMFHFIEEIDLNLFCARFL